MIQVWVGGWRGRQERGRTFEVGKNFVENFRSRNVNERKDKVRSTFVIYIFKTFVLRSRLVLLEVIADEEDEDEESDGWKIEATKEKMVIIRENFDLDTSDVYSRRQYYGRN